MQPINNSIKLMTKAAGGHEENMNGDAVGNIKQQK